MARIADQNKLRTLRLPKDIMSRAEDVAHAAITAHVLQFLSVYHGNVRELAVGCYFQGLYDAAKMAHDSPGWPHVPIPDTVGAIAL